MPLQKAATFPKLLENVPGGAPPDLPSEDAYVDLAAEKQYFLSVLFREETRRTGATSITRLIESSSERNFFEMSLHRLPVHQEFVKRFCLGTPANLAAASAQLLHFRAANTMHASANEDFLDETLTHLRKAIGVAA